MKRRFSWLGMALAAGLLFLLPWRTAAPKAAMADEATAAATPPAPAEAAQAPDTADAGPQAGLAAVPWKIGEYFQFSIDWNGLNGGGSLMQVQNIVRVDGRRAYRIVTKAESNSFVSKFYKVRDRAESFVDAESLYSVRFVKHLREGGYKKDVDVRFEQSAGKARYDDGKTYDVPKRVHDVLSAFYYVRTVPLPDGATLSIPTHDNEKTYEMVVKVHGREKVEVPAGKFDCVVVEPILKSEGVFKSKGSILVYLSDDARRIPVMVKSKIPIGSIAVSLTDMRLAFPGRH
ncbi:MAG TPA: DUF3108 domain-containing protein [Candidatus Eisenbacteria bacterium]|nr:DUF3108 domain-containing protein [Candidatus Eisenbacteria bacterium]